VLSAGAGEDGFGAVYLAVQTKLDRGGDQGDAPQLGSSRVGSERFLREARLASRLDHPHAAHVYASGEEDGVGLWIAMELVRGTALDRALRINGPLSVERLVPLLDRICEVAHTAHEQGIVHCDLKPANVMVLARRQPAAEAPRLWNREGNLRQLARGRDPPSGDGPSPDELATTIDESEFGPDGELTQRGAIIGSPLYMAPEQWLDAGTVDRRTDVYALGIVAFEAAFLEAGASGRPAQRAGARARRARCADAVQLAGQRPRAAQHHRARRVAV
jgi:serine/threonine-protein kinase